MNRHHRARYWRLIDRLNSSVGWLIEPLFAVSLGAAAAWLLVAFIDAAIRIGRL